MMNRGNIVNKYLLAFCTIIALFFNDLASCIHNTNTTSVPASQNLNELQPSRVIITNSPDALKTSSINGYVIRKSDISAKNNSPLAEVLVIAILSDKFDLLLEEIGARPELKNNLSLLDIRISEDLFQNYVANSTISQQNGEYTLQLSPGSYLLCLANLGLPPKPRDLPALVSGCIEINLQEKSQVIQNISWGEAGVGRE